MLQNEHASVPIAHSAQRTAPDVAIITALTEPAFASGTVTAEGRRAIQL